MQDNDVRDAIVDLLAARPLPDDAAARLDALIGRLPEDERQAARMQYHAALATADLAHDGAVGSEALDL